MKHLVRIYTNHYMHNFYWNGVEIQNSKHTLKKMLMKKHNLIKASVKHLGRSYLKNTKGY